MLHLRRRVLWIGQASEQGHSKNLKQKARRAHTGGFIGPVSSFLNFSKREGKKILFNGRKLLYASCNCCFLCCLLPQCRVAKGGKHLPWQRDKNPVRRDHLPLLGIPRAGILCAGIERQQRNVKYLKSLKSDGLSTVQTGRR